MSENPQRDEAQPDPLEPLVDFCRSSTLVNTVLQTIIVQGPSDPVEWDHFRGNVWEMMTARRLPMGGARDARNLSAHILRKNISNLGEAIRMHPKSFGLLVISTWAHCNQLLRESAKRLAQERGLHTVDFDKKRRYGPEEWPLDWQPIQFDLLAQELATQANVPADQARLMLFMVCIKAGRAKSQDQTSPQASAPASQEAGEVVERKMVPVTNEVKQAVSSEMLTRFLNALNALPDEAPEWQQLDAFLAGCREVLNSRMERKQARRHLLETALQGLSSADSKDGLTRLPHLQGHERWNVGAVAEDSLERVAQQVDRLVHLLAEVVALFKLPPPKDVLEMRERNKHSERLFGDVEQFHMQLAVEFGLADGPPTPPGGHHESPRESTAPASEPSPTSATAAEATGHLLQPPLVSNTGSTSKVQVVPTAATEPQAEPLQATLSDAQQAAIVQVAPPEPLNTVPTPPSAVRELESALPATAPTGAPVLSGNSPSGAVTNVLSPPPVVVVEPVPVHVVNSSAELLQPASLPAQTEPPPLPRSTRQDAAQALLQRPSLETQAALLYALVTDGDIAGAYWLARALEAQAGDSPVPSWLLSALAGASRLQGDSTVLTAGLLQISSTHPSPQEEHLQPLAVAAALPSIIRAPGSGLASWLVTPDSYRYLRSIIDPVRAFSLHGLNLPADSQLILRGRTERAERISAAIVDLRRWREKVEGQRTSYIPAKQVLDYMLAEGELAELLESALQNDRSHLDDLGKQLLLWRDRSYAEVIVDEMRRRKDVNKKSIVGPAQQWIHSRIEELCNLVRTWHELALLDERLSNNYDWVINQLDELRRKVATALPEVLQALREHTQENDSAPVAAGVAALRRALFQLADMLSCRPPGEALAQPADVAFREQLLEIEGGLEAMLERRLLTLPAIYLPADRKQWGGALQALFQELPREILSDWRLESCIEGWLARRDFRFIPRLLHLVADQQRRQEFEDRMRLEQEAARRSLKQHIERTRADIEQAVVDGFIGDERAALIGRLDGLSTEPAREFDTPERVLQDIAQELSAARSQGLQGQREQWQRLQPRLAQVNWDSGQRELAMRRLDELLSAGDYRSADELLARLEDCVENNKEFDTTLFAAPPKEARYLEDFLLVLPRWELELKNIRRRDVPKRAQEYLPASERPTEGHGDLRALHETWQALVDARTRPEKVPDLLIALLRQLGFGVEGQTEETCTLLGRSPHPLYQLSTSSRQLSPVPHFGSRVDKHLRVLCVWSPPERREVLTGALQQLKSDAEGTLVLYLDRLELVRRRQLCRQAGTAALVIDEWLLLYAASLAEGDSRLRALFECGLPFSSINPYIPRAGTVPPEMFFGREEMARRLASFDGTCLVYGGRQLGKSALLEHVQRRFEETYGHVAIRLDIKEVGDPTAYQVPEQLWPRIREELKRVRFLSGQVTTDKPDVLLGYIGEALEGPKGRKLLILLDEADNFLDADSRRGFEQVKRLRDLMSKHPGRCKVVLAGLHNVQRFQGIANQPLAHFGSALLVGPLEAQDADALVRRPMEALGFRFPSEDKNGSVLRILSYTNYHPGLIQLFCRELVALLQRRADLQHQPPFLVREADVEEVYRRQETRHLIRERFEWTLALDPRYQAVVWSLIVQQEGGRDGFSQSFSTSALLSLVRGFWAQGFEGVESDQMRGLLEEMVGLGVLVRNAHGEYRLRSPNVVRLLGSITDIYDRLDELAKKKPVPVFNVDHHHMLLEKGPPPHFSPLTFEQERTLLSEPSSSVVLLVGSTASHVQELQQALRRSLVHPERPNLGALVVIPPELRRAKLLRDWLEEQFKERRSAERVLFFRELSAAEASSGEVVDAAEKFCEQTRRTKKRWARVVFVLRPLAAWEWLTVASLTRPQFEDRLIPLKRWTRLALDRLFEEADIRSADEAFLKRVLEVTTGGWPCLLQHFAAECRKHQNERRVAEQMEKDLHAPGSQATAFWEALELEGLPRIVDVLKLIRDMGGASPDTTFEDVLDGNVSSLKGRSEALLQLLQKVGCLESRGGMLHVERRVAEALPS